MNYFWDCVHEGLNNQYMCLCGFVNLVTFTLCIYPTTLPSCVCQVLSMYSYVFMNNVYFHSIIYTVAQWGSIGQQYAMCYVELSKAHGRNPCLNVHV